MSLNKDTAVGIVGAAILVVAVVGIFYYEAIQAPLPANMTTPPGSVTMPVAVHGNESWMGTVQAATPALAVRDDPHTLTLPANVSVNFTVTWEGPWTLRLLVDDALAAEGPSPLMVTRALAVGEHRVDVGGSVAANAAYTAKAEW